MMEEPNKILTVSYGTFSCRLEGFDDSVETMKTVVSYFHELAGHDRFMDMDPQAPDMETLARLTEEQADAPVTVEGEGQNVSLRVAAAIVTDEDVADEDEPVEAFDAAEDEIEAEELADDGDTIVLHTPEEELTEDGAPEASVEDDADEDELAAETAVDDAVNDEDEEDDSVAAKLQRIRAVVGRTDVAKADSETDDTFAEDLSETPAESVAAPVNPLAQRLADLAKRNAERAAEEAGIALDLADDADDDDLTAEELAELDAEFTAEDEESDVDVDDMVKDDVLQLDASDLTDDDELEDDVAFAEDEDEDADDAGPLVLTPQAGVAADSDDDADEDYDLHEEVAEAQREIEEKEENRSKRSDLRDTVKANMTRILTQTDEHLNEPEGRRHRDAFAQLKAAVAATEAARQLGDPGANTRDKDEVFREDLGALDAEEANENAVRSEIVDEPVEEIVDHVVEDVAEELAEADEGVVEDTVDADLTDEIAEEIAEEAPTIAAAPLKLVSSQSAQATSKPLDAASVRLRDIAAQKETPTASKGDFAEFAAQQGATELADLLEAAAAYIAFVEGDADFSRPQVMKKVQTASSTDISREDGLRSFGRLLRQSKIIKLNNGRFQVAEDTRFRPEDKAAQG